MHESVQIDQLDRELIGALQIHPRASWAQLAPILSTSASTLSRRWDTIAAAGLAWSTVIVEGAEAQLTFVDVNCGSGRREDTIMALSEAAEVVSIDACAGEHDLILTLSTPSIRAADEIVNERITIAPGVTRTRSHYANGIVVEGSSYRIKGLTEEQQRAVSGLKPRRHTTTRSAPTPTQLRIVEKLAGDARKPASEIARQTGLSTSHVQRQLALMASEPWFVSRTDISVFDFGLVAVYLWVRCPINQLSGFIHFARQSPGLRMLVPIVSRANILCSVWLPGLDEISEFERRLAGAFPAVEIMDRWLQTANRKRVGLILDKNGRRRLEYTDVLGQGELGPGRVGLQVEALDIRRTIRRPRCPSTPGPSDTVPDPVFLAILGRVPGGVVKADIGVEPNPV